MTLKILLPFKVFLETNDVQKIVVETFNGSYGILPRRLDCVAAIEPGIFEYQQNGKTNYLAMDSGILVKTGKQVLVSVHNVFGGADVGGLLKLVEKEQDNLDENEQHLKIVTAKLEVSLIHRLDKLRKE